MSADLSGESDLDNYSSNHDYLNEDDGNFFKTGIMAIFVMELGFALFLMNGQVGV